MVRFHDAIPITHPHVLNDPYRHLNGYYYALRANSRHAFFACVSEASRRNLVMLYQELEERSEVIPDMIAPVYHNKKASGDKFDLERMAIRHLAVYGLGFRGLRDRYQFTHNLRRKTQPEIRGDGQYTGTPKELQNVNPRLVSVQ